MDFTTGYLDNALFDAEAVVDRAVGDLTGANFDTLVGTGFSGALVVPMIAARLGCHFILVRKPNDGSHHTTSRLIGTLGKRWVFVDDFESSGATRRRVVDEIADAVEARRGSYLDSDLETEFVGRYFYAAHVVGRGLIGPA